MQQIFSSCDFNKYFFTIFDQEFNPSLLINSFFANSLVNVNQND